MTRCTPPWPPSWTTSNSHRRHRASSRTPSLTITPPHVSGPAGTVLGTVQGRNQQRPPPPSERLGRHRHRHGRDNVLERGRHDAARGWNHARRRPARRSGCAPRVPPSRCSRPRRTATVPSGNVYLYNGNIVGVSDAQHLILAKTDTLAHHCQSRAEFLPPGSLVVRKTITGPAAGSQARVVIHVACDDGVAREDFIIRAGTRGTKSKTYAPIPAGTRCTVTETRNGSVFGTNVVVIHGAQEATIPSGGSDDGESQGFLLPRRLAAREEDDRRSGCGPCKGRSRSTPSAMASP